MKKQFITLLAGCLISLTVGAVPANPRWIKQLADNGETSKWEQVIQRRERKQNVISHTNNQVAKAPGQIQTAYPLNIAPRGLVILVNFSDLSWTKATHAEMDSMLNGQNYTRNYSYSYGGTRYSVQSSGSAKKFYQDCSFGQYNPEFTVVGPVTVSRGYAYYGGNDSSGDDMHPEEMVAEACQLVNDQVDFSLFDNDGDGDIDFVYIFYAGYQESDGAGNNYIWPHSYELDYYYYLSTREGGLGNAAVMLDGKRLNKYACSGEIEYYSKQHDGIGTFCHEFGHVLGLRDHYATDESSHKTLGFWDTMDAGPYNNEGNTPPLFSAYEQFFLGWLTPTVISDTGSYSLNPLTQEQKAYLLCAGGTHNLVGNDPNPTTFYMLENRQNEGWDEYLPGHGMILTKIKYNYNKWRDNEINNTASSMGYDLIEADGRAPSSNNEDYYGKATDAFPAGATSYSGISGYPINAIAEHNGVISFRIGNGGGVTPGPGGGDGNCDNYSWTASRSLSAGDVTLEDYSWTITAPSGAYFGYDGPNNNDRGAQFGSGKNPIQSVSLATSEVMDCLISSVTVSAAMGNGGDSKLSLYINGTQVGTTKSLTSSTTQYTFQNTANLIGQLEIRITNTQKAAYIKTIEISQTSASTDIRTAEEQQPEVRKMIQNGQLFILRDDATYDILGRRVR